MIDPNQPPSSPQQLVYSSYFTSAGSQVIYSVDIDPSGTIWATGFSTSNPFPNGAQNPSVGKMSGIVFSMTLQ